MFNVTMLEGKITNVAHHDAIQHNWQRGGQDLPSQGVASSLNLNNYNSWQLSCVIFDFMVTKSYKARLLC
jgi:hypothetical protein